MASKTQSHRFINLINQQIDILKGEKKTVLEAVDDAVNQVQSEVDAWVNGGAVNQTTFVQMNNRITQVINLLMIKSDEISEIKENENDLNQMSSATSTVSICPKTSNTKEESQGRTMMSREETLNKSDTGETSYISTTRFAILEEAVFSLKKTTEQFREKQENVNKKLEILTTANKKSQKKIKERLIELEKKSKENSSNVDELFETATNVNDKLNRLENENKSVNVSMNELNKQISSVRTCSNDVLMSIQNLSKSFESTNQHYNEMSNKMNQLEISINLISTQYAEQFKYMDCLNKDKSDDLIGMVCQLISKRLAPLETLNETLNKKSILSKEHISKVNTDLAEISGKVRQIESKFIQHTVGFDALKKCEFRRGCCHIKNFDDVSTNYGSHFNLSSGQFTAPLVGFYLISINSIGVKCKSFNIRCLQILKTPPNIFYNYRQLCCIPENAYVTRFVELKEGDVLALQAENMMEQPTGCITIKFSCSLIK